MAFLCRFLKVPVEEYGTCEALEDLFSILGYYHEKNRGLLGLFPKKKLKDFLLPAFFEYDDAIIALKTMERAEFDFEEDSDQVFLHTGSTEECLYLSKHRLDRISIGKVVRCCGFTLRNQRCKRKTSSRIPFCHSHRAFAKMNQTLLFMEQRDKNSELAEEPSFEENCVFLFETVISSDDYANRSFLAEDDLEFVPGDRVLFCIVHSLEERTLEILAALTRNLKIVLCKDYQTPQLLTQNFEISATAFPQEEFESAQNWISENFQEFINIIPDLICIFPLVINSKVVLHAIVTNFKYRPIDSLPLSKFSEEMKSEYPISFSEGILTNCSPSLNFLSLQRLFSMYSTNPPSTVVRNGDVIGYGGSCGGIIQTKEKQYFLSCAHVFKPKLRDAMEFDWPYCSKAFLQEASLVLAKVLIQELPELNLLDGQKVSLISRLRSQMKNYDSNFERDWKPLFQDILELITELKSEKDKSAFAGYEHVLRGIVKFPIISGISSENAILPGEDSSSSDELRSRFVLDIALIPIPKSLIGSFVELSTRKELKEASHNLVSAARTLCFDAEALIEVPGPPFECFKRGWRTGISSGHILQTIDVLESNINGGLTMAKIESSFGMDFGLKESKTWLQGQYLVNPSQDYFLLEGDSGSMVFANFKENVGIPVGICCARIGKIGVVLPFPKIRKWLDAKFPDDWKFVSE